MLGQHMLTGNSVLI